MPEESLLDETISSIEIKWQLFEDFTNVRFGLLYFVFYISEILLDIFSV